MKKKKILIFASDERGTLELINVVKEINKRNHDFFFLYSNEINVQFPTITLENFTYDTNVLDNKESIRCKSLGNLEIPFIPDIVLVSRENWEPEKSIFIEFKQMGSIICCVENSSWFHAEIDSKLELCSRKNFPTNLIDIFFDHSDWVFETKKLAGWVNYKTKIVGIPKFDNLKEIIEYKKTRPVIIIYGSVNGFVHSEIIKQTIQIVNKLSVDYEIFYKPHPVEFIDFYNDFEDNFTKLKNIDNVKVIKEEKEYQSIVKSSDINIGIFSSVMYYPLILDKKIVVFDIKESGADKGFNIDNFNGDKLNFWAPIVKVKSYEELVLLIDEDFIDKAVSRKNSLLEIINSNLVQYDYEFNWLYSSINSNNKQVINYFDNFSDFNASSRIVNEIEKLYV